MATRWCRLYRGTPAELALEDAVAALGVPYRTQMPLFLYGARYFPDVVLPTLNLVMEIDDSSHRRADKMADDIERTDRLRDLYGWTVVRCTNEEALSDPYGAVRRMVGEAGLWPLPARRPLLRDSMPSPRAAPQKERRAAKSAALKRKRGLA